MIAGSRNYETIVCRTRHMYCMKSDKGFSAAIIVICRHNRVPLLIFVLFVYIVDSDFYIPNPLKIYLLILLFV